MKGFVTFLTIFLSVYILMHLTVYFWLRSVFALRGPAAWTLAIGLFILLLSFPVGRWLTSSHAQPFSEVALLTGYYWLGILFCLFSMAFVGFAMLGLTRLFGTIVSIDAGKLTPFFARGTLAIIAILIVAMLIGHRTVRHPVLRTHRLAIDRLPSSAAPLRIVQLSDLHIDELRSPEWFRPIVESVNALKPDLIALTGDIIDGPPDRLSAFIPLLETLEARHGVFGITGNHEYYIGARQTTEFLSGRGIIMLRNSVRTIPGVMHLIGLDDPSGTAHFGETPFDPDDLAKSLTPDLPIVLLYHQPRIPELPGQRPDLQLSGHTHNGQIWPFTLLTGLVFELQTGLHEVSPGRYVYVSSGTGIWGPPFRILTESEITLFELTGRALTR